MTTIAEKKFEILDAVYRSKDGCSVNELAEMLNELGRMIQKDINKEFLRKELYVFRDLFCQNIDLSSIDEYIDERF